MEEYYFQIQFTFIKIIGIIGLLLFSLTGTGLLISIFILTNMILLYIILFLFNLLFIYITYLFFVISGISYVNNNGMGVLNRKGNYFLKWDAIQYVYHFNGTMLIGNKNQMFSMPAHYYGSSKKKYLFNHRFLHEIGIRKIIYSTNLKAFWPKFKNCKLKDSQNI